MVKKSSAANSAQPYVGVQGASCPGSVARRQDTGELAKQFGLQPNQITDWKRQLIEREAVMVGGETDAGPWMGLAQLHAKIGQHT
jgi:transposase-like protein